MQCYVYVAVQCYVYVAVQCYVYNDNVRYYITSFVYVDDLYNNNTRSRSRIHSYILIS